VWQQYQTAVTALAEALGYRFDEKRRLYYYDEVTVKSWVLGDGGRSGNCPVCVENADEGEIDMDGLFPSGDAEPPAHPNCTCTVEYRDTRKRVYV
jgi:hypothetical protein